MAMAAILFVDAFIIFLSFFDYWEFWNAIDWLSIITGFVLLFMWVSMTGSISGPLRTSIEALPAYPTADGLAGVDNFVFGTAGKYLTESELQLNTGLTLP